LPGPAAAAQRASIAPLLVALGALTLALLLNPLGYRGGGGDDWHYLEAARCAAAHGLCAPESHWWARLPLVAPMGLVLAVGGESRFTVALVPLAYALTALLCFTLLVRRHFGGFAAGVAGLLLATLPVGAIVALQPNIDLVELAFLMAGLLALDSAWRRESRLLAVLAGLLFGLALLARPTALVALALLALFVAVHPSLRRFAVPLAIGLAVPVLLELLLYGVWLGDPFHGWRLSLSHTSVWTAELPAGFHSTRGPLLNPDYIAAWRRPLGIHVHWTVDPLLNTFADPAIGPLLAAGLALLLLARPPLKEREGRAAAWLAGAAILLYGALTYGLALDPKARMFFPVAAAAAAIAGLAAARLRKQGKLPLAALIVAVVVAAALVRIRMEPNLAGLEPEARAWLAAGSGDLAMENRTARFLTLVPGVRALPIDPAPGRMRVMAIGFDHCAALPGFAGWPVERAFYLEAQRHGTEVPALCLFRRR
jgi:4-amino-4-deoxy-L-arabinose transferase-like glycosyltransferase